MAGSARNGADVAPSSASRVVRGETLRIGGSDIEVVFKDIRNIHLSVHPPDGRVRISAPLHMTLETIRLFAVSKLAWIRQQQKGFLGQERETPRELLDRESHWLWGKRYLLKVVEIDAPARVEKRHGTLVLRVRPEKAAPSGRKTDTSPSVDDRPGTTNEKRHEILEEWYREQVRAAALPLVSIWASRLGLPVAEICVRRMRTKWGSCTPRRRSIRLNTELAKKPPECLEYIVVHELLHFIEPTHGKRFVALMERFMPKWRYYREELNRLPIRHERWGY